jgi:hypothetical protein
MPKNTEYSEACPICGTETKVSERAWYYTCTGCGSGINLIGIWWKEHSGQDWMDLSETQKKQAGDQFYQRPSAKKWKDEILEI